MKLHIVLAFLCTTGLSAAQVTTPSDNLDRILSKASDFKDVSSVEQIPDAIVAFCTDYKGRLANPGQEWQVTDVIQDPSLPMAHLIWARSNGEYYVVHHEHGGYGHSYQITIAQVTKNEQKPRVTLDGVNWQNVDVESRLNYDAFLMTFRKLKIERNGWPKTVAEAVDQILKDLPNNTKELIKSTKKQDLTKFRLGWGIDIRNKLGLWSGNDALMKDCKTKFVDEASMVIIEAVWERLQK